MRAGSGGGGVGGFVTSERVYYMLFFVVDINISLCLLKNLNKVHIKFYRSTFRFAFLTSDPNVCLLLLCEKHYNSLNATIGSKISK